MRTGIQATLILLAVACAARAEESPDALRSTVEQVLAEGVHPFVADLDLTKDRATLLALYERRDWQALWSTHGTPTRAALAALEMLRRAASYGLEAADYQGNQILYNLADLAATPAATPERWAQVDLAISAAVLRFITHVHSGRIDPKAVGFDIAVSADRIDRLQLIEQLAGSVDPQAIVASIEPPFEHYRLLKRALAKFRDLALEPGLTDLPAPGVRSIKVGERYAGAAALRRLLVALGDLPADRVAPAADLVLDRDASEALRRYQALHGLQADGTLGRETFRHLSTPLLTRVKQIELTLERWRWLPRLESPPIFVNIPQYRLFAFRTNEDRERDMERMDVIVGHAYPNTRTPVFTEEMRYLVFRPYWDVPYSIATRELLPEIRRDPAYLDRKQLEIVRGGGDDAKPVPPTPENLAALAAGQLRIRQRPGPDNSLGLVKFMLPNAYNVYLHSTPAQGLFRESRRAFSHGCIRVSDPVGLAEYVLRDEPGDWSRQKIAAAMQGATTLRVNLSRPIRVFILYGTAIAGESGEVAFFDDVYGHDAKLAALLAAG